IGVEHIDVAIHTVDHPHFLLIGREVDAVTPRAVRLLARRVGNLSQSLGWRPRFDAPDHLAAAEILADLGDLVAEEAVDVRVKKSLVVGYGERANSFRERP